MFSIIIIYIFYCYKLWFDVVCWNLLQVVLVNELNIYILYDFVYICILNVLMNYFLKINFILFYNYVKGSLYLFV